MFGRSGKTKAEGLIGKHALVGLTYTHADGTLREQRQMHGRITAFDPKNGFSLLLHGSDHEVNLPPMVEAFEPARPGEYRLRATGEVVVDPDVIATWRIAPPEDAD